MITAYIHGPEVQNVARHGEVVHIGVRARGGGDATLFFQGWDAWDEFVADVAARR